MDLTKNRLKGIELYCSDFRDLNVPADSAALIVADPMWNDPQQFNDLGVFASQVLKPGGKLLLFSGSFDLPDKLGAVAQHLNFVLPLAIVYSFPRPKLEERVRTPVPLHQALLHPNRRFKGQKGLQYFEAYLPLTLWVKGHWKVTQIRPFYNVFFDEGYEKEFHEYQQSLDAIRHYVGLLTEPGDLVIEPFGGGFTVAQAVRLINRDDPGRSLRCIACDIKPGCVETGRRRLLETDR
jgi:DNA modification methylase